MLRFVCRRNNCLTPVCAIKVKSDRVKYGTPGSLLDLATLFPGPWPVESLSNVLGCFDLISFFVNVCRVFDSIVVGAMRALSAWLQKEND